MECDGLPLAADYWRRDRFSTEWRRPIDRRQRRLDLGQTKKATRYFGIGQGDIPASVNGDLSLDLTGWLWTLAASYAVVQQEGFSMSVLAGARMLDLEETLQWQLNGDISTLPVVDRTGSANAEATQWDALA